MLEVRKMSDYICFHAFENIYGIPLEMVAETFDEQKVSIVPCMNPMFLGVCNHNGVVLPVLSFSRLCNKDIPDKRRCMLLLQVERYQLILQMNDVPFIVYGSEMTSEAEYEGGNDVLKIKHVYQKDGQTIYALDMLKILDILAENMLYMPEDTL